MKLFIKHISMRRVIRKVLVEPDYTNFTNEELLTEILKRVSINNISELLNVCSGTVKRWLDLNSVPPQYRIDLLKLVGSRIEYDIFSSKEKDQFFTPSDLAIKCWESFLRNVKVPIEDYTFIEPSAGDGSFLSVLPSGSIALDIEPRHKSVIEQDYLTWTPPDGAYIVFGNPPFGLRGHLALQFINHSESFADYVCFILPQLFESDGKGSPRKRVKGYNLIHSEKLTGLFYTPEQTNVEVNGVFQIWSKHDVNDAYSIHPPNESRVKVYSLSDGGTVSSTRNKDMIDKCDIYLPSTCFGKETMRVYESFNDLPGKKGYGIVFHIDREEMIDRSKNIDWGSVSFLSTNSAYNLRTSLIHAQFSETS